MKYFLEYAAEVCVLEAQSKSNENNRILLSYCTVMEEYFECWNHNHTFLKNWNIFEILYRYGSIYSIEICFKNKLGIWKYFGIMEEIPIINTMQYYARLKKSIRII